MRQTYVWCPEQQKVVPKHEAMLRETKRPFNVMRDLEPFISPVDNKEISSRSHRREHNKRHGVVDVGDDKTVLRPRQLYKPPPAHEDVKRVLEEFNG